MNIVGHWIEILCFKHDGNIHREWDRGLVVEDNEDYFIVVSNKAKVVESTGRKWFTSDSTLSIFAKKDWFNVICMIKPNGVSYYCNIASPTILENWVLKYVDYDLDLKVYPNGRYRVLDENEYKAHKIKYGYSEELDKVINYKLGKVIQMAKDKVFPFNDEKVKKIVDNYLASRKEKD